MKRKFQHIALAVFCLAAFSCKKDNYEEPKSKLSGRFHYKGESIHVQHDQVPFELYQYGFGRVAPIVGHLTQEGTYSHVLFDGEYKLIVRPGQGPFVWPETGGKSDSLTVTLKGDKQLDIEVTPYYMIRTPQIVKNGSNLTATFKAEKIITDAARAKNIRTVGLYISKTQFVSANDFYPNARTEMAGSTIADPNNVSLSVAIPTISPTQNYVFARIGLRIEGVEDWIYSPVVKINL